MATAQIIATVLSVTGQVIARNEQGQVRILKVGDELENGEVILSSSNGYAQLAIVDGDFVQVEPDQTFTLTTELAQFTAPDATEAALAQGTVDPLVEAILSGAEFESLLEAPAAGVSAGAGNEGSSFVRLLRISEGIDATDAGLQDAGAKTSDQTLGGGTSDQNPNAVPDSAVTDEDTPILIDVLANDTDPNNDPLTVAAIGQGDNGSVSLDPDSGLPFYTPNPGFTGQDSFEYTVTDPAGNTSVTTVDVTVNPVNGAPQANPDQRAADEDSIALSGNVITAPNAGEQADTDPDGDPLSVVSVAAGSVQGSVGNALAGSFGTLTLNADGSYSYALNPELQSLDDGESVIDEFSYTVSDGTASSTTTLSITINGSNDGPVANPDIRGATQDSVSLSGNVITAPNVGEQADTDADGDALTVSAVSFGGLAGTPGTALAGAFGSLSLNSDGSYNYVLSPAAQALAADQAASDVFVYTVSDGTATASTTLTIAINGSNDGPIAVADVGSTPEDVPLTLAVLNNDSDPDGDALTVITVNAQAISVGGVVNVGGGSVSLLPNGSLQFSPSANFNGPVDFTYTISDGQLTDTTTVSINVTPVNDPPIAQDDTAATAEDTPVTVAVLGNDSDPDNDPLSVIAINGQAIAVGGSVSTAQGSVALNADGTLTFTPNPGFNGPADFDYTVSDGQASDTARVSISVSSENDQPQANPDQRSLSEDDASISGNVITAPNAGEQADTDPDGDPLSVTAVVFGAAAGTVGGALAGAFGSLVLNADGSYTYTPNAAAQSLDDGETGVDVFTYTVSDGQASSTTTLQVTVSGSNDGPVAIDDIGQTLEDTPVTIAVLNNDSDPDNDPLSVVTVAGQAISVGNSVAIPEGSVVLNADGTLTFTPLLNFNGPVSFDYSISDGDLTDTATVRITVDNDNDPPVAGADARSLNEDDASISGNVISAPNPGEQADTDPDGNVLNVTAIGFGAVAGTVGSALAGMYGSLVLNADGSYTYTPNAAAQTLDDGETGVDVFTYTVSDGALTDTTTLTVTVNGSNDGPVALADVRALDEDDASISGNVITAPNAGEQADTDVDGDTLNVTAIEFGATAGTLGSALAGMYGSLVLNADGSYTYAPNAAAQGLDDGETGVDVFTYTVSDGDATDTTTLTVTVNGTNDGPVALADVRALGEDDASISGNVITAPNIGEQADTDLDGDALNVTAIVFGATAGTVGSALAGMYGSLVLNADGSYTYTPNATAQTLDDGETGVDVFTYTVSDGDLSATTTLTITVNGSNDGPIANDDIGKTPEDTPITIAVLGNDSDPENDPLSVVTVAGQPISVGAPVTIAEGSVDLNADGTLTFSPLLNFNGPVSFTYTISDGDLTDTATVRITVDNENDPPVAQADVRSLGEDDAAISGNVITAPNVGEQADTDPDADILNITAIEFGTTAGTVGSALAGMYGSLVLNADGSYTYTPNAAAQGLDDGETGVDVFTYTVSDGALSDTTTLTVTVNGTNDGPVALADARDLNEDDASISGNVITAPNTGEQEDTDVDGDTLNVTAIEFGTTAGTVGSALAGMYGSLVLNADGSYTYTPNAAAQGLDDGETGVDIFTYTISDGDATDTTTLTITVNGTNDGPVALADVRELDEDDASISGNVITAPNTGEQEDTDVDGDTLNVTAIEFGTTAGTVGSALAGMYGSLVLNADGSYTYTPNAAAQGLDDGETGVDIFTYTVSDGDLTDTTTLTITVNGTNDGPVALADVRELDEDDASISGNVITAPNTGEQEDTDVDGDTLNVTAIEFGTTAGTVGSALAGMYGSLVLNADGSYTYTPNAAAQGLDDGETGVDVFTYTVSDGALSDTTTLTVTVNGTNDGPVALADARDLNEDDASISGNVITAPNTGEQEDTDVDGDTLNVTAIEFGTTAGTVGSALAGMYGSLVLNADGSYTYTPNAAAQGLDDGETGVDIFTYTVSDGDLTDMTTLTITVNGSNDGPVALADVRELDEDDASISGNVITAPNVGEQEDTDVDGDTLNVTAIEFGTTAGTVGSALAGMYGSLVLNADGSYTYTPNAAAQGLDDGETGVDIFTYTVSDGDLTDTTTLTITVNGTNDGPVALADVRELDEDDASISGNVITAPNTGEQEDTDVDGDTLNVTAIEFGTTAGTVGSALAGMYGSLVLNADGSYTYTPNAAAQGLDDGETGVDIFTYTISDGDLTDTTTLTITVNGTNDGPVALADVRELDEDDASISGNVITAPNTGEQEDTDVDGDTLNVTAIEFGTTAGTVGSALAGMYGSLVLNADGSYTYTPNAAAQGLDDGETGVDIFTYTVSDGDLTDMTTLTITVNGTNDGPVALADVRELDEDDASISGNVITAPNTGEQEDTDVDGDTLNVTAIEFGTTAGTVGSALAGMYGSLVLNADGSYTYTPNAAAQGLDDGETGVDIFTYTISDGDLTDTTTLTITVEGDNDGPHISSASANVSEEGLPDGLADTLGTIDTTNAASVSGNLTVTDPEGDSVVSVGLQPPALALTSGGVTVTWSGIGTDTLLGSAGSTPVMTLTLTTGGAYEFTLHRPLDHPDPTQEDALALQFGLSASDGSASGNGSLTITVEDDAPHALVGDHTLQLTNSNLLVVLDVSGSMGQNDGVGGQTRLQTAIQSINTLMDRYDELGGVAVRIVTFSSGANAQGSQWTDIATAQAQLAALSAGGSTNYDAALTTAQSAFGSTGSLSDGQNVAYFLSDGRPNRPTDSVGINGAEETQWTGFLEANDINAFALGMGTGVNQSNLNPIAYDGVTPQNTNAIVVSDFAQLETVLVGTVPTVVSGELLRETTVSGDMSGVGGDGGYVQQLIIEGTSYAYNPAAGGSITVSGGPDRSGFDASTQTLSVETTGGGSFIVDMDDGAYRYGGPDSISGTILERMDFTVVDNDGDNATSYVEVSVTSSKAAVISGKLLASSESLSEPMGEALLGTPDADVFAWDLADRGSVGLPKEQHVQGFDPHSPADGGDALNLADLLQGENEGTLTDYLHFDVSGSDTVVQISSEGQFSQGYDTALVDQRIVLEGVDLSQGGSLHSDLQIIQDLLNKGSLITD